MEFFVSTFTIAVSVLVCCVCLRFVEPDVSESGVVKRFPAVGRIEKYHVLLAMLPVQVGLLLLLTLYYGSNPFLIGRYLLLLSILWVCAWNDLVEQLIPNRLLGIALVVRGGLLAMECLAAPDNIRYILLSSGIAAVGLFAMGMLCRLVSPQSLGFGDVKLLAVMGLFLGIENTWNVMLSSMLILFVLSVILLAAKKAKRDTEIPFAPFLLAGMILAGILMGV